MNEFEKIYQAYFNDVFLYVKKLSGNADIAEEITGETFFKALHAIDKFRGDCEIRVWLCQIAKNTYFQYLKSNSRLTELTELTTDSTAQSIEDALIEKDSSMHIHLILHDLQEPYKEVFWLRVFGEMSFSQIARVFGKTENWACVTYHRARTKIKEKMEEPHHEK